MKKVEYSQIVRRKLKNLRARLTSEFGAEVSRKSIKQITDAARGLEDFEEKGISVSSMYGIECDYRYIYAGRNYLFYRIESDKIIIAEMFDEREDFMYKKLEDDRQNLCEDPGAEELCSSSSDTTEELYSSSATDTCGGGSSLVPTESR